MTPRSSIRFRLWWWLLAALVLGGRGLVLGQDLIHFHDGRPALRAEILLLAADLLKARILLDTPSGTASAERSFSMADVSAIDFTLPPALAAVLAHPALADEKALIGWWNESRLMARRPRHYVGQIGLALAELSLAQDSGVARARALEIYRFLEAEAWDPTHRHLARRGRLRAWMALGKLAEAEKEAESLAHDEEDPDLLIEARAILADVRHAALREFLKAHPRWAEEEEARTERDRLYHETLDLCLWPALFHGTHEPAAARGMWHAVAVYAEAHEARAARDTAEDLASLYPATPAGLAAQKWLAAGATAPPGPVR
jgi:hypothetical protein